MVMKRVGYVALLFILLAGAAGCKKNTQTDLKPDLNVANDQVLANRAFLYLFRMVARAAGDSLLQATHHATIDSALVTLDAKNQKYTFAFRGSLGADSVGRGGSFIATIDSGFFHKGTVIKLTFLGYAENTHHISGSDSIRCLGLVNGAYLYDNIIRSAGISKDSVSTIRFGAIYRTSVEVNKMARGTRQTVISFSGTSGGTSSGGYAFSATVDRNLVLYETCPWICDDGLIAFTIPGVDISSGTIEFMAKSGCNDKLTYDFQGNTYYLRMQEKYLYN